MGTKVINYCMHAGESLGARLAHFHIAKRAASVYMYTYMYMYTIVYTMYIVQGAYMYMHAHVYV